MMANLAELVITPGFVYAVIRVTTPILFATLAAMVTQRAGVTNIAIEGTMLFSALFGVLGSAFFGSAFVGVLFALAIALVISGVLAYFTLVLDSDNTLTCIAMNLLASGATIFLLFMITGDRGMSASLNSMVVPVWHIPIIRDIPILGDIVSGHFSLTYIAFLSVIVVHVLLFKMPLGLQIRSVGENPDAASSVGISVKKTRFIAFLICAVLAGLGGAFMSMGYLSMFTRDMVAGRGFIALAASNVGGQAPIGGMLAAMLFGFFDALANNMQLFQIPSELVQTIPYIATIILLCVSSYRKMKGAKSKKS